eukprot:TsM_000417500 transcript=TsM_000417500 gene=TsM_000417500
MRDVRLQDIFSVAGNAITGEPVTAAFFVPYCNFTPPQNGTDVDADLRTSFPLSRFVADQVTFEIDFAVKRAESYQQTTLNVNGKVLCEWEGENLTVNESDVCNLRIFHGKFTKKPNVTYENFVWSARNSFLIVSVDYTQSGTSPEVAECEIR